MKGGYFPVPPVDSAQDIRSEMCVWSWEQMGSVARSAPPRRSDRRSETKCDPLNTMTKKSTKFRFTNMSCITWSIKLAHRDLMPKPMFGDNGSGMHCHMSPAKNAPTCSLATNMPACLNKHCTTSAASSNTPAINAANPTYQLPTKRLVPVTKRR